MIDITRALVPNHPVWPGDDPFTLKPTGSIAEGDPVNTTTVTLPVHLGTHVDAPYHYAQEGERLAEVALERWCGEALVIDASAAAEAVTPAVLEGLELPARVLLYTGQPAHWDAFPEGFTPLTTELIAALAERGVKVVGTDCPSVDALGSESLPVHQACFDHDVLIIEGLNLAEVKPGRYRLLCLPLHLPEADGAPARAILEAR
jgi:arylformamidase